MQTSGQKVYNIIESISKTSSRNEKLSILETVIDSDIEELFKCVLMLTYSPNINYYIKDFDIPIDFDGDPIQLDTALLRLTSISDREMTGDTARETLNDILRQCVDYETKSIVASVVRRDLRCGVSASTINKVWPKLIYVHPYMRCSSLSEKSISKIQYPCYAQTKIDGMYCDIMVGEDSVIYMSRNGQQLTLNDAGRDTMLLQSVPNTVVCCEILVYDEDGEVMDRQSSNGYINSDSRDMSRISFVYWDGIPIQDFNNGKSDTRYSDRIADTQQLKGLEQYGLIHVDEYVCNNFDDIVAAFTDARTKGQEGIIIKNTDMKWANGTSKDQIKVKVVIDVDLKLVGYKKGKPGTKYEDAIGSLKLESDCGTVSVYCGTGLKDTDRFSLIDNIDEYIEEEKIVKIKCNGLLANVNTDITSEYSLFLPVFVEFRDDKTDADDYNTIKDLEDSFIDIMKIIK